MLLNVIEEIRAENLYIRCPGCIIMPSAFIRRRYKGDGKIARRLLRRTALSYLNHNKLLKVIWKKQVSKYDLNFASKF